MIGVLAPPGMYRAAVAELPLRTRPVDREDGAVVVVPGGPRWVDAGLAAVAAGARAVVVADPGFAAAADVRRLAQAGIPVIIERPLLREDVSSDANDARGSESGWTEPRAVVVDGVAPAAKRLEVLCDALGWVRVLSGGRLTLVAADAALALLETTGAMPATLTFVATERPSGWIRAHALGEVITEVEVVEGRARVATTTVAGRLTAPTRFESSERLAMRRALDALERDVLPRDLDDLAADAGLAARIIDATP